MLIIYNNQAYNLDMIRSIKLDHTTVYLYRNRLTECSPDDPAMPYILRYETEQLAEEAFRMITSANSIDISPDTVQHHYEHTASLSDAIVALDHYIKERSGD